MMEMAIRVLPLVVEEVEPEMQIMAQLLQAVMAPMV
jgi:hypothetical protein